MTDSAVSPDRGSSFKWTERKAKRINILFYWLKLTLGGSGHSTNEWKRNKEENKSYGENCYWKEKSILIFVERRQINLENDHCLILREDIKKMFNILGCNKIYSLLGKKRSFLFLFFKEVLHRKIIKVYVGISKLKN